VSGLGTGIATALAVNSGSTGAPALLGSAGAFTTLSASGNLTLSAANPSLIGGTNAGSVSIQNPDAGAYISVYGSTHATKANKIEIIGTGGVSVAGALAISNTVAVSVAAASTHKVTMVIGGVTYYLLASNV
jgi:hypothetical protein